MKIFLALRSCKLHSPRQLNSENTVDAFMIELYNQLADDALLQQVERVALPKLVY